MAKNSFKKTLTKSNLNLAGMKDKYITVPKDQVNPEDFFGMPPRDIKFLDKVSKSYFLFPFKKEKNGEHRLSRLRAFFELKKASVGDHILINKKIKKDKSFYYEIEFIRINHARINEEDTLFADELSPGEEAEMIEGGKKTVAVNIYERSIEARNKCIKYWGHSCTVCRMQFEDVYGKIGKGFIHVHHLVPISEIGKKYRIDPIKDLRPVCPNCHAMIHKRKPTPFTTEELRKKIK